MCRPYQHQWRVALLRKYWLWGLLGWICCFSAFAANQIRLDEQLRHQSLFPALSYQITDKHLSAEDIVFESKHALAFKPLFKPRQTFLMNQNAIWFHAKLNYVGQRPGQFILAYPFRSADVVEFYWFDRQNQELQRLGKLGSHLPFSERQISSRDFAVEINFKANQELELLIKVQDGALVQSDFSLWQKEKYLLQQLNFDLMDGILLGLLLLISAYHGLFYWYLRTSQHCYLAVFFCSFALTLSILNGAGFALLWPEYPELNPVILYVSVGACMASFSLATQALLQRSTDLGLWWHLLLSGLLLFSPLYIDFQHRLLLLIIVVALVIAGNLWRVIRHQPQHSASKQSMVVGWLLFAGCTVFLFLAEFGHVQTPAVWHTLLLACLVSTMAVTSRNLALELKQAQEQSSQAHEQAIESLKQYYDIYHNAVEGMFTSTLDGQLITANRALLQILGYQELSQMQADVRQYGMGRYYANADDRTHMLRQLQHSNNKSFELRGLRADGTPFWAFMSARLSHDSAGHAFVHGSVIDITEQKISHEQLAYLASHDPLTGLYNRHHFSTLSQQAWQRMQLDQQTSALLYLDIDQFKLVNSTCNHTAGDALLLQISEQMKRALNQNGILARIGGDEFAVLLPGKTAQEAFAIAYHLLDVVKEFRFFWQDSLFSISVSIGISEIAKDDLSAEQSLKKADSACFVAKEKGRNRIHLFNPDDQELHKEQSEMQWLHILQRALENDNFILYVQPIQPMQQRDSLHHYELLLRLRADDGSLIAPGNFISSAERFGLMPQIDRWVIRQYFRWVAQHPQHLTLLGHCHINLSGASLLDPLFKAYVLALFKEFKIPYRQICFEISESMAILNLQNTLDFIQHFRSLGCQFALDDFGSGFSSYGYLKNFPVDYIKIDGNFVRDLMSDKFDRAIVNSIHDVATAMGIKTVAEFVESQDILQVLRSMGVDYGQGYGIAKPKPLSDLTRG